MSFEIVDKNGQSIKLSLDFDAVERLEEIGLYVSNMIGEDSITSILHDWYFDSRKILESITVLCDCAGVHTDDLKKRFDQTSIWAARDQLVDQFVFFSAPEAQALLRKMVKTLRDHGIEGLSKMEKTMFDFVNDAEQIFGSKFTGTPATSESETDTAS